jgi:quercetin dioxygenase-like cupin family protein
VGTHVSVISLDEVEPVELPNGSWSRLLVTGERTGSASSLGYSLFTPGTLTAAVCHELEEVVYVVAGTGELRLDDGAVGFATGQALHIPPGVWHAVANTGTEDVVMVFGFPHPEYPPTERR